MFVSTNIRGMRANCLSGDTPNERVARHLNLFACPPPSLPAPLQVRGMLSLVESLPGTRIRIFSGLAPGGVKRALLLAAAEHGVEPEPSPDVVRAVGSGGRGGTSGAPRDGLGTVILAAATAATAAAAEAVGS